MQEETQPPGRSDPGAPRATILLVDDDSHLRRILADLLTHHGYGVIEAASGPDALRIVQTLVPDLAILDLRMPQMDGLELAQRLREFSRLRDLPLVMLTVETNVARWREALSAGVQTYLLKPCRHDDLLREVRRLLVKSTPRNGC